MGINSTNVWKGNVSGEQGDRFMMLVTHSGFFLRI